RASCFALAAFVVWGAAGCGATPKPPDGSAPPAEVLYLVHNEIWRIGADDTGAIYPYLVSQGQIHTVGATNVTIHDSIAAATIGGAAALVYTVTPYVGGRAALMRANPAGSDVQGVALELGGVLSDPSPWDDGSV